MGSALGRGLGIIAAAFAAVTAMFWMPYYPIWSLMYVAIGTVVIWALTTGGNSEA